MHTSHTPYQAPFPIECPHCGRHSVVQLNSTSYGCLNCHHHFDLDFDHHRRSSVIAALAGGILLLFALL